MVTRLVQMNYKPDKAKNGPGRPTREQQKSKKEIIFQLLGRGFKPPFIIQKTHYHKDTVYKYYEEYKKTYVQEDGKTIAEREDEDRTSVKLALEDLIYRSYVILDETDDEIKNTKKEARKPDRYLYDSRVRMIEQIRKLEMDRIAVLVVPNSKQLKEEIKNDYAKKGKRNG